MFLLGRGRIGGIEWPQLPQNKSMQDKTKFLKIKLALFLHEKSILYARTEAFSERNNATLSASIRDIMSIKQRLNQKKINI